MSKQRILLASSNPGKCREIRQGLGDLPVDLVDLSDVSPMPEPVEDGETFAENARRKAQYYATRVGGWALADDSGLVVDALGGAPGVRSARYAADACDADASRDVIDAANNRRLLAELEGTPDEARTARFVCHLTLATPEAVLLEAFGVLEGRIAHEARGENGFGYDPLFFVPRMECTTAELTREDKNAISHRGQAVRRFKLLLTDLLACGDRGDGPEPPRP